MKKNKWNIEISQAILTLWSIKVKYSVSKKANDSNRHFSKESFWITNKHMKRCSIPLAIREIQINARKKNHFTHTRITIIKKIKKKKTENNKCYQKYEKFTTLIYYLGTVKWHGFLKKLNAWILYIQQIYPMYIHK